MKAKPAAAPSTKARRVRGEPSWTLRGDRVECSITCEGGQLAPVRFQLGRRVVEPFSIAPWAGEKAAASQPPLLKCLRGDFFCAPFGLGDTTYRGENHPAHGEPANRFWKLESLGHSGTVARLHLSLETKVRPGRIDKTILLKPGHTVVYSRHVLHGMAGPMNLGHHAMLHFPDPDETGLLSTSRLLFGQVLPRPFEHPHAAGYQSLRPSAQFKVFNRVPTSDGGTTDLGRYPDRSGFDDLVMVVHEASPDFAWTAAVYPDSGYVWFALKDPRVLRSTVFWFSNGGRHYAPWNGRHRRVVGIEDVTSYFHRGLPDSARPNPVSRLGYPTCLRLRKNHPLVVNYLMGVAAIPRGFGRVTRITRVPGGVRITSATGMSVHSPVDTDFLHS